MWANRISAGEELAKKLSAFKDNPNAIVLALPRGGVKTAYPIAQALNLPLDILVVRKLGAPTAPELAIGALSFDGQLVLDRPFISKIGISEDYINAIMNAEKDEAARRLQLYRGKKPLPSLKNKTVILVDDGIATGATMQVAIKSARAQGAHTIIVAIPVIPLDITSTISSKADALVYLEDPAFFPGVGAFYQSFPQVSDQEVIDTLQRI